MNFYRISKNSNLLLAMLSLSVISYQNKYDIISIIFHKLKQNKNHFSMKNK
jgi:hypothetical protein